MLYLSHRVERAHQVGRVFEPFEESLLILAALPSSQIARAEVNETRRVHIGTVGYLTNPREAPRFQELAPDFYDLIIIQNAEYQSAMPNWRQIYLGFQVPRRSSQILWTFLSFDLSIMASWINVRPGIANGKGMATGVQELFMYPTLDR